MSSLHLEPEAASARAILRIALLRDRRGHRLGAATLGFMLHQAGEAAVPILLGVVIDQAVVRGDVWALVLWLTVLALVFVVLSMSYQRAALGMVRVYGHGEHDLRQLTAARALHPRRSKTTRGVGEVLSVTSSDTFRLAGVAWSIAEQGATVAALIVASVALLIISPVLGIGVLVGAVAVLLSMQALARPLEKLGMIEQSSVAGASDIATDTMDGLRIVRGLGAEAEMVRRYRVASRASLRGAVQSARRLVTYNSVSTAVSVVYLAVLAFAAAVMASNGHITIGQLVTVVALAQFLQGSLAHIGTFGANWAHKRGSARRVEAFVADPYQLPPERSGATDSATASADIPLAWVQDDGTTVEIAAGEMTGVMVSGASQARELSAKLGRRSSIEPGQLWVFGRDAVALAPDDYRRVVVAPPHDSAVFSGSIADNLVGPIAVSGRAESGAPACDSDVIRAAALDDVVAHVGTITADIGEGGQRLSGGQRQRVLLGRVLHEPAEVLVLDEPTSALDPLTEHAVALALRDLGRTIVVITSSPLLLDACHHVVDLSRRAHSASSGAKGLS